MTDPARATGGEEIGVDRVAGVVAPGFGNSELMPHDSVQRGGEGVPVDVPESPQYLHGQGEPDAADVVAVEGDVDRGLAHKSQGGECERNPDILTGRKIGVERAGGVTEQVEGSANSPGPVKQPRHRVSAVARSVQDQVRRSVAQRETLEFDLRLGFVPHQARVRWTGRIQLDVGDMGREWWSHRHFLRNGMRDAQGFERRRAAASLRDRADSKNRSISVANGRRPQPVGFGRVAPGDGEQERSLRERAEQVDLDIEPKGKE